MQKNNFRTLTDENYVFPYEGKNPQIDKSVFVASGTKIIGDVKIEEGASIWYNCVIRGDVHYIKIGKYTNIQDLSMLHVSVDTHPLNIGAYVTVGHSVKLHGCTIEDYTLIGIGSVVLDGAIVKTKSVVAAGAVVTPGFVVPSGKLVAGIPAKIVRDLTDEEIKYLTISAEHYFDYSRQSLKSFKAEDL